MVAFKTEDTLAGMREYFRVFTNNVRLPSSDKESEFALTYREHICRVAEEIFLELYIETLLFDIQQQEILRQMEEDKLALYEWHCRKYRTMSILGSETKAEKFLILRNDTRKTLSYIEGAAEEMLEKLIGRYMNTKEVLVEAFNRRMEHALFVYDFECWNAWYGRKSR